MVSMAHNAMSRLLLSKQVSTQELNTKNYNYHYTRVYESNASDRDSYQRRQETVDHNMNTRWTKEIQLTQW